MVRISYSGRTSLRALKSTGAFMQNRNITNLLTGTLPVLPRGLDRSGPQIVRRTAEIASRCAAAASGGRSASEPRSRGLGHELARDLVLAAELDAANSTKVSTRAEGRRRQRAARRGGRRRGYDSGELLPAVQGTGASTSNPCGFLTSTRTIGATPR
jgi:hypothetical protein